MKRKENFFQIKLRENKMNNIKISDKETALLKMKENLALGYTTRYDYEKTVLEIELSFIRKEYQEECERLTREFHQRINELVG